MKNFFYKLILLSVTITTANAQDQSFNYEPWFKPNYPIVVNINQTYSIRFDTINTDKKIMGIIHKASEGLLADKAFGYRQKLAASKQLLYGSYHVGTNADATEQADFYLKIINTTKKEVMALYLEDKTENAMTLTNAIVFIERVYKKTKRYPFVYVTPKVFTAIANDYDSTSVFAKCPLWYAYFTPKLLPLETRVWKTVSLWQFCGSFNSQKARNCAYQVPGASNDVCVNVFNGSRTDWLAIWKK